LKNVTVLVIAAMLEEVQVFQTGCLIPGTLLIVAGE
jgi:hypothetical protein